MLHVKEINALRELTDMGEGAAINRYQIERRTAEDRRRNSRGPDRRVVSTNWLK